MAAQADVENAVRSVAARAGGLRDGPDDSVVDVAVAEVMTQGEPMIAFLTEVLVGSEESPRSTTRATSRRTRGSGPSGPS